MKRPDDSARGAFLCVLLVALAVRIACLLALRGDAAIRVPLLDAQHYLKTAAVLAGGEGWPKGPHFMAPIYPFLLSGIFRFAPAAVETVQWAQLVLGVMTCAFVFLAANRISRGAGLAAGLLYALCAPAIVYENQVLMEALIAFCLAALVWLAGEEKAALGPVRSGLGGLAIGLATAGRPTYLFLLPLLGLLILRSAPDAASRNRSLAALLCAFGLVVLPPSIHNWRETGRPSFVTVSGGLNLYIGNNPSATGIYSQPAGLFLEKDPTGARSASQMAGRTLGPDEASRYFAGRAWSFLHEHPGAAAKLWIRKAGYLLGPDEVPQIESIDELERAHGSLRFMTSIGFAILLPLAFLGAIGGRRRSRTWQACLGVIGAGAVAHLVFFSTGRYRAALLPAFSVLAGSGIAILPGAFRKRTTSPTSLWPIVLGAAILVIAPRYDRKMAMAWEYHQAGIRFDELETPRAAEEMYRRALGIDPALGESWHNLGASLAKQGRTAEAIEDYERALRTLGENPVTLYNLASLYGRLGMDEKALSYLDRSVAVDPADPAVRVDRGVALYRLGRREEALSEWRRVAGSAPGEPSLGRTLGQLARAGVPLPADLARLATTPPR